MHVQPQPSVISSGRPTGRNAVDLQAPQRCRQRGFTLVELMIAVAVAAVLLMIAVPGFRNVTLSNKLDTAAGDLVNAIGVARMEAIKRNARTQFCSNSARANTRDTLGGACGAAAGAVWAMSGGAPDQVYAGPASLVPPIRLDGDLVALRFGTQGVAWQAGGSAPYGDRVADICTSELSRDNHRVITMAAGSIVTTAVASGSCPAS